MILVILEESNPSGQDQFKSVFSVCVLINVCRDDKSDNDDLFSFTCPVDNVKLDCSIVSICPLIRQQCVVVDGERSDFVPALSGVPQGSVIGPVLFLAYINDFPQNIRSRVRLFAYNTILYLTIASGDHRRQLQDDLDALQKWKAT